MNININALDIVTLFIIGYALFAGYKRGFISILFDALAIGTSFYVASKYHSVFDVFFKKTFHLKGAWVTFLTLLLTYVVSFVFFKLMGMLLTRYLSDSPIGGINKISGMMLNVIKWLFIVMVVMMLVIRLPYKDFQKYCKKSLIYLSYKEVAQIPGIKKFLP